MEVEMYEKKHTVVAPLLNECKIDYNNKMVQM